MQSKNQIERNTQWNLKDSDFAQLFTTRDILGEILSPLKTPFDLAIASQICSTFYKTITGIPNLNELYIKQNKISLSFFFNRKITVQEVRDTTLFSEIRSQLNIKETYTFYIGNTAIKDDRTPKDYNLTENSKISYAILMGFD